MAKWLLPLSAKRYGLQFCPACLAGAPTPYFRRHWRLAFMSACEVHGQPYLTACPRCSAPLWLFAYPLRSDWRSSKPEPLHVCRTCGHDLRCSHEPCGPLEPPLAATLAYQAHLLAVLKRGWAMMEPGKPLYSHLLFAVVHRLLRVLITGGKAARLAAAARDGLGLTPVPERYRPEAHFERLPGRERGELLALVGWLLDDWPERFVNVCRQERIHAGTLLHGLKRPPFWFWSVVVERLRVLYAPWRDPARVGQRARLSYTEIGQRRTRLYARRIDLARAHPELWHEPGALDRALRAAGLCSQKHHHRLNEQFLIAQAQAPDPWWRFYTRAETGREGPISPIG